MKALKVGATLLFALVLTSLALFLTPWEEHQRGRFYLSYLEPFRAWNFRNWERVLPYRTVAKSSSPRRYLREPADFDAVAIRQHGEALSFQDYLDKQKITGLMVLEDGKVRFEHYDRGVKADTRYHLWSASKSFTATLIGIALHEGLIDSLDDPIEKYAPEFAGSVYGETTLHHLLMMSSGVDFKHFDYSPNRLDFYFDVVMKRERISDWALELGRRVPQGMDFNYLATDTHVLSTALKGVYGKPLAQVLSEKLWEPGGFTADAIWSMDAEGSEGVELGHCCLAVTLTDFAHLGQLYLEDLVMSGQPTVPGDWFERVANTHGAFQEPTIEANGEEASMGYSYQFWLPPGYDNEFVARGALGQYLWIDRKRGFVVAQFSIAAVHNDVRYTRMMRAIGDALE